jgi:tagatose-6-phosphate ketose/aldose isomerase
MELDFFAGHEGSYYIERSAKFTASEIAQQPMLWIELAKILLDRKTEIARFMGKVLGVPQLRIILAGAGSSAYIGEMISMAAAGEFGIAAVSVHTTDIVSVPNSTLFPEIPTLMISFARSGNSPESVGAVKYARKKIKDLYEIFIMCEPQSELAEHINGNEKALTLLMPQGSADVGFAMTSSVSCMALAVWCLFNYKSIEKCCDDILKLADFCHKNMEKTALIAEKIAQEKYDRLVFIGSGALKGLAHEAAVKSLELTNGTVNASYESPVGFRHGPKSVINDSTLTVHFISPQEFTAKYDIDLAKEIISEQKSNKTVVLRPKGKYKSIMDPNYEICYEAPKYHCGSEIYAAIHMLIFCQSLALFKSLSLGITADNPCLEGQINRVVRGVTIYSL